MPPFVCCDIYTFFNVLSTFFLKKSFNQFGGSSHCWNFDKLLDAAPFKFKFYSS